MNEMIYIVTSFSLISGRKSPRDLQKFRVTSDEYNNNTHTRARARSHAQSGAVVSYFVVLSCPKKRRRKKEKHETTGDVVRSVGPGRRGRFARTQ